MAARYRIRPARPADRDAIHAVEEASFAAPWDAESFVVGRPFILLVAETDQSVVGFAMGQHVLDEGEVLNLAVMPDWRRSGVGVALLENLLTEMQNAGARAVYLDVRESNVSARSLYQKAGFSVVGVRTGYYADPPENAVQMSRFLGV